MMDISIEIDKNQVIDTLARTTGYIGAKNTDNDQGAYKRISLNDGDRRLLEGFFNECCDVLSLVLRRHISEQSLPGRIYRLALKLSQAFDPALIESLKESIIHYMVMAMASKWLAITHSQKAKEYADAANETLAGLQRKIYCKMPPQRPKFD